jgi:putative pyruvate formate lyase activating enzyme
VQRNHRLAYNQGELIVRHLVMPHHGSCCSQPILHWIRENIPKTLVNVMDQYRPAYHASDHKDIAEPLAPEEYHLIREYAESLDLYLV